MVYQYGLVLTIMVYTNSILQNVREHFFIHVKILPLQIYHIETCGAESMLVESSYFARNCSTYWLNML